MNFELDIERIYEQLSNNPKKNGYNYDIDIYNANDKRWSNIVTASERIKILKETIKKYFSNASVEIIRLSTFRDGTNPMIRTHMETLTITKNPNTTAEIIQPEHNNSHFSGFGALEVERLKNENNVSLLKMQHQIEINELKGQLKQYIEKVEQLQKEISELDKEINELENENASLEDALIKHESKNQQVLQGSLAMIGGKVLGMKDDEMKQLAGFIFGGERDDLSLPEKGGGIVDEEITPEQKQRNAKTDMIVSWMKNSPADLFEQYWQFMTIITNHSGAFKTAYTAVAPYVNNENNIQEDKDDNQDISD